MNGRVPPSEVFVIGETTTPEPQPEEVRIRVHAPDGVDHIVEVVFHSNIAADERLLGLGSSIATYATGDPAPAIPFWPLAFKNVRLFFLGSDDFPAEAKVAAAHRLNEILEGEWHRQRKSRRRAVFVVGELVAIRAACPGAQTGLCGSSGHAMGARHCASAHSGEREVSQSAATYRLPVIASAALLHSQSIGGVITSGAIRSSRPNPDSTGTMAVSVGPPGTTTFTVTPPCASSLAWPADMASIPALHGP